MKRLIHIALLLAAALSLTARADNSSTLRRGALQPSTDVTITSPRPAAPQQPLMTDSIAIFLPDSLSFKNFDKTASSSQESFFITNDTPWHLSRVVLGIRYLRADTDETLHERTATIDIDIPAGATRQAVIKSFDRQHSYYYYRSQQPRKAATAFKVVFKVLRYDIIAQ